MAKGTVSKQTIIETILNTFDGAFMVDPKELRIPMLEDGAEVQIKVALTCAKENIPHEGGAADAGTVVVSKPAPADTSMTAEEVNEVKSLMERLNL